ncbi:MAG: ABC transporter ATP-binding protein [Planctomycetota bacterium]|jgi:lipoprotein-releasing system ATP-binding protein
MSDPILTAEQLTKVYKTGAGDLQVLKGIDLAVERGEMLSIIGRSGAGKSTLLHLLGLLDTPSSGRLVYDGADLAGVGTARRAAIRNQDFGFVFQFYHLLPEFSALENVLMAAQVGASVLGWLGKKAAARERATQLLTRVGLEQRLGHRPNQLSGGEQQRVAIARALMNDPQVLFCDEPTGNLDSVTAASVTELLFELNRERGQTCVLVTHDDLLAERADRVARLVDGAVESVQPGANPDRAGGGA